MRPSRFRPRLAEYRTGRRGSCKLARCLQSSAFETADQPGTKREVGTLKLAKQPAINYDFVEAKKQTFPDWGIIDLEQMALT